MCISIYYPLFVDIMNKLPITMMFLGYLKAPLSLAGTPFDFWWIILGLEKLSYMNFQNRVQKFWSQWIRILEIKIFLEKNTKTWNGGAIGSISWLNLNDWAN